LTPAQRQHLEAALRSSNWFAVFPGTPAERWADGSGKMFTFDEAVVRANLIGPKQIGGGNKVKRKEKP
jgi:hypothetical protein